jgi:hypothetical protein
MQVEFRESFAYGAWIVSSNFGTQASYRIYIRVLYPSGSNWFANKHLGDDAAKILKRRTFQGVSEAEKWDAIERYGVQVKSNSKPKKHISTNTVVDFRRIDRKLAAYFLAKALFEAMMYDKFGSDYRNVSKSADVGELEVDFNGITCVISAGQDPGITSKMLVGARRVSTLNSRNQVSFEVFHCAGAVDADAEII